MINLVGTAAIKKAMKAARQGPDNPGAILGYGTDYALPVHERKNARHRAPTKAGYLREPFDNAMSGYRARIQKEA